MRIFNIFALFCLVGFLLHRLHAQESDVNLESLKASSMPSATIIGAQINEVNRPKSLKALETAVFSNYLNSNQSITIPNNYALEFNPFMLSERKNFKYEDYIDNEPLSNMWRNLSISVSSTTDFMISDSTTSNAMGFGFRTIILNGEPEKKIEIAYSTALEEQRISGFIKSYVRTTISEFIDSLKEASTIDDVRSFVLKDLEKRYEDQKVTDETVYDHTTHYMILANVSSVFDDIEGDTSIEDIEEAFEENYDTNISSTTLAELRKTLSQIKHKRYGFRWEVDFASALSFPTNEFDNRIWPKWGFWSNVSYQSQSKIWEDFIFIGLCRIIVNNDKFYSKYRPFDDVFNISDFYDLGARIVYEYQKLSVEFEYIYRFNKKEIKGIIKGEDFKCYIEDDTKKYILNVNYNIADNINLSYNIGKNFDNIPNVGENLISGLSINFGFGDIQAADLLPKK